MTKEKEANFFGKRKPQGKLVENFYVSQEEGNMRIKVEHKSGDFNFRLFCGERLKYWYETFTNADFSQAYAEIFSGVKVFTILAIQHADFYRDYALWMKEYFDAKKTETTEEESQAIIQEMKQEDEDNQKLKDGLERAETDGSESGREEGVGGNTDSGEGNETEPGENN